MGHHKPESCEQQTEAKVHQSVTKTGRQTAGKMSAGLASHISSCDLWTVGSEFGISHSDGVDLSGFVAAVQAAGAAGGETWSSDDAGWGNVVLFSAFSTKGEQFTHHVLPQCCCTSCSPRHNNILSPWHLLLAVSKSSDHFTFIEYDSEVTALTLHDDS